MIKESELILNPDGSIYHLNLRPEQIAHTVITVGDPERVERVTRHFDRVDVKVSKREFCTHTGELNGTRLTVISTGIGTDNIDIVFNELDALVNIDLEKRTLKEAQTSLNLIRIGTSGCLQEDLPIDCWLASRYSVGYDGLLNFYESDAVRNEAWETDLDFVAGMKPYVVNGSEKLIKSLADDLEQGFTATCTGFYGPQGRQLRLPPKVADLLDKLKGVKPGGNRITNFEMETAGIYGLAALLGHEALSLNVLIANRARGEFSKDPVASVDGLIERTLDKLTNKPS